MRWTGWYLFIITAFAQSLSAQEFREAPRPKTEQEGRFSRMRAGVDPVVDPGSRQLVEGAEKDLDDTAKWLVYRLTQPRYWNEKDRSDGSGKETMNTLLEDARRKLLVAPKKVNRIGVDGNEQFDRQLDFVREFGKIMEKRLKEVLQSRKPIVRINAARMMVDLAKSGYWPLADTLATMLTDDKESDAVKLSIAEAAGALLAVNSVETPDNPLISIFPKKELDRENKLVQALMTFVARPPKISANALPEEVEALRFVRRAGVRALGQVRRSVLKNELDRPVAYPGHLLLQVAVGDKRIVPSPSPSERLEALIGFCQLAPDATLNADLAAVAVVFAAQEVGRELRREQDERDPISTLPWKVVGARLKVAFDGWDERAKAVNWDANKTKLMRDAFKTIETHLAIPLETTGKTANKANGLDLEMLNNWMKEHVAKSATLFAGEPAKETTFVFQ